MTSMFKGDKKNGLSIQYFPNKKPFKETLYVDDFREGEERTYFDNGALAGLYHYSKGQLDGLCQNWNQDEALVFEGEYKEGKRHGIFNKYYADGRPQVLQTYFDDQLHGTKRSFNEDGIVSEVTFEMGQRR